MRRCLQVLKFLSLWIIGIFLLIARDSLFAQTFNYADSAVITVKTGQDAIIVYDSTHATQKAVGKIFKGEFVKVYRITSPSVWRRVEYNGIKGWISPSGTSKVDSAFYKTPGGFKSNQVKFIVENDSLLYLVLEPQNDKEAAIALLIKNNSIQNADTLFFTKTRPKVLTHLNVFDGDTLVFIPANKNFLSFRSSLSDLKAILPAQPEKDQIEVVGGYLENLWPQEKTISLNFKNIKSGTNFSALKLVDSENDSTSSVANTAMSLTTFHYKLDGMNVRRIEKAFYLQLGEAKKTINLTLIRQSHLTPLEIILGFLLLLTAGIFLFRKKLKNAFFNNPAKLEKKLIQRIQSVKRRLEELMRSTEGAKLADQNASIPNQALTDIADIIQEDFRGINNKQNLLQEHVKLELVVAELLINKNDKVEALIKEARLKLQEYQQALQTKIKALEQFSNQTESQTPDTTEVEAKKEDQEIVAEQITESAVSEAQQGLLDDKFVKIFNEVAYIKKAVDDFKKARNDIAKIGSIENAIKTAFGNGLERISREVSQDIEAVKKAFAEHESNIQAFLRDEKTSREKFAEQGKKNDELRQELQTAKNELNRLTNEVGEKKKTIEHLNTDKEKLDQRLADSDKENQRFQQINKYGIEKRFLVITDLEKEALKRFQSSLDRLLHLFADYKESIGRLRQKVGLPAEIFRFNLAPFEALWECVQEMEAYESVYKTDLIRTKLNVSSTEMSFKSFMEKLHDYSKKGAVVSNLDYLFIGLQKIYHLDKKTNMAANSDIDEAVNALKGTDRLIREVVKEWVGLFPEPIALLDPFTDHEKYCKPSPHVVSAKNYYPGVDIKPGTIVDILNWVYREGEKWNTKAMVYISG